MESELSPEAEPAPDVITFFDANMPKMDSCREGCEDNVAVLCRHRFNFNNRLVGLGNLNGLSDFRVVWRFIDLINKNIWWCHGKKRPFILVTKDLNFIKDVEMDYFDELQNGTTDIKLKFKFNFIICHLRKPVIILQVFTVEHKPYGFIRKDDLCDAIEKLNQFWSKHALSPILIQELNK